MNEAPDHLPAIKEEGVTTNPELKRSRDDTIQYPLNKKKSGGGNPVLPENAPQNPAISVANQSSVIVVEHLASNNISNNTFISKMSYYKNQHKTIFSISIIKRSLILLPTSLLRCKLSTSLTLIPTLPPRVSPVLSTPITKAITAPGV